MTFALVSTYCVPDTGGRTGPLPGIHRQSGMWVRPALRKDVMQERGKDGYSLWTDRGGGRCSDVEDEQDEHLPSTTVAWDTEVSLRALNAKMRQGME